ncbi:MAG: hypothetical protein NTV01_04235 [Bacteroidia bacterium]|nr:hypothetical protein [Bacteroidia bacterium]
MKFKIFFIACSILLNWGCRNKAGSPASTFQDARDKRIYSMVTIGKQTWMAENLAYLPAIDYPSSGSKTRPWYYVFSYNDGDYPAAVATAEPAFFITGVLYNWPAAKSACPPGWHLPSDEEWKVLEKHLGMSRTDADTTGWRQAQSITLGLKSTKVWAMHANGNNATGFSAFPGGYRNDRGFFDFGYNANFWTSTEGGATNAWSRILYLDPNEVNRGVDSKSYGFSVRCVRNQQGEAPGDSFLSWDDEEPWVEYCLDSTYKVVIDTVIAIFDTRSGEKIRTLPMPLGSVNTIAMHPSASHLVVMDSWKVKVCDLNGGDSAGLYDSSTAWYDDNYVDPSGVDAMEFSADGRFLLLFDFSEDHIRIYQWPGLDILADEYIGLNHGFTWENRKGKVVFQYSEIDFKQYTYQVVFPASPNELEFSAPVCIDSMPIEGFEEYWKK